MINIKKIIWIFGESATGKKTLIETIINNSNLHLLKELNLENKKIEVVKRTISKNLSSFNDKINEKTRHEQILASINDFVQSNDSSILLLKGQSNDMDDRYGNTLKTIALFYPEIDKEIYLLEVNDNDLLYSRIINKDWFKKNEEEYSKIFPRSWIDNAVIRHKEQVYSYVNLGYKITEIDSTNGYKLINKENKEYGQSSSIRR